MGNNTAVLGNDNIDSTYLKGSVNFNRLIFFQIHRVLQVVLKLSSDGYEVEWGTASGGANKIDDLSDALLNTSKNNLFLGHNANSISASNDYNVAVGITALDAITSGNKTRMGHESLSSNTSGESNTAIGAALNQNITGNWNTATGYQSLFQSTGDNNVAYGFQAGKNLTVVKIMFLLVMMQTLVTQILLQQTLLLLEQAQLGLEIIRL